MFQWARDANPKQPLTSGVWAVDTSPDGANLGELQQIQLRESDIITFHNYSWPEYFKREVTWLKKYSFQVVQFSRATSLSEENAVEGTTHSNWQLYCSIPNAAQVLQSLGSVHSRWAQGKNRAKIRCRTLLSCDRRYRQRSAACVYLA